MGNTVGSIKTVTLAPDCRASIRERRLHKNCKRKTFFKQKRSFKRGRILYICSTCLLKQKIKTSNSKDAAGNAKKASKIRNIDNLYTKPYLCSYCMGNMHLEKNLM